MRMILFIYNIFCILIMFGCIHKNDSTSLQKVNISYSNDSVKKNDKSIVLQLINGDTIALPARKVDVVND